MKTQIPVSHIAKLANIPITSDEEQKLQAAFEETLAVVEELQAVDVTDVQPTFQVTGLENVTREDTIDETRMFTQEQALANARATADGYFVVPQIISQD
ncbi:Asp-tRNA(Asn)/Glu-tRNA(Gln) amidotransferase subunit GatC [Patescibacteria group bacterium]|nr:Asp-tRNA(Asn)/Glu-tRNA(Gln) amidotransferase subunit GatC [Patescibacteria group bacterium]